MVTGLKILAETLPGDMSNMLPRLLPWLIVLFLVILFGGLGLMWYRARLKAKYGSEDPIGFTLADLKKLRERGEISEQEFEVARNRTLLKLNANLAGKAKKLEKEGEEKEGGQQKSV